MGWAFDIGSLFGIRVRVHWLFLALLGYFLFFGGGVASAVMVCLVFAFVVFHELGHSLTARHFGVGVLDITLLPIGGVARLTGDPPGPKAEMAIAMAGPLVNLGFALLLLPLALLTGAGEMAWGLDILGSMSRFFSALFWINLVLALFNLLPAFPMDGGRILRAGLALRTDWISATRWAVKVGRWAAVLMGIAGLLLARPMLILIAVFIFFAGKQEEVAAWRRQFYVPDDGAAGYSDPRWKVGHRFTFREYRADDLEEEFDRIHR